MAGFAAFFFCGLLLTIALVVAAGTRYTRHRPRLTFATALAHGLPGAPGDVNLTGEEWTLDRPDGAHLPVWDVTGDNPDARVVVIVHDWGSSRYASLRIAHDLRAHMSRCICYDMRGHGDAIGHATLDHRDVEDLADLRTRIDADDLVLVGFGFGGAVVERAEPALARCVVTSHAAVHEMLRAHWNVRRLPLPSLIPLMIAMRSALGHDVWPPPVEGDDRVQCARLDDVAAVLRQFSPDSSSTTHPAVHPDDPGQ